MEAERINLDRGTRRRWPFLVRMLLLAITVIGAYVAGWATARRGAVDADRQVAVLKEALGKDEADALSAKDAVLELMRRSPTSFEGCNPEELARLPLNKMENDGMWSFGENTVDLRELTYKCTWFYMPDRLEGFQYEGALVLDGEHWIARSPKKSRVRFKRGDLQGKT
jgi:hypothetical protein